LIEQKRRGNSVQQTQAISPAAPGWVLSATARSDETLIRLIAANSKEAMRLLYARHNVKVYRFVLRIVGNEATAEDVLNEVFVEVWRNAAKFEARSQVSTWILAIARFRALSSLRRRSDDELEDEAAEAIEDKGDDPEVALQKSNRRAVLLDCLKQLSPAHREVLDLIYYHEKTVEDAALIVGIPLNTVKTRAFHARKRLAKLMEAKGIERSWL
jgi:RNA polymerase sigma-70 factor (ECF subfamily)